MRSATLSASHAHDNRRSFLPRKGPLTLEQGSDVATFDQDQDLAAELSRRLGVGIHGALALPSAADVDEACRLRTFLAGRAVGFEDDRVLGEVARILDLQASCEKESIR